MSDINCPYCEKEIDINHDDGYGYNEDEVYVQECGYCKKTFTYTTTTIFYYDLQKAPCQNGEPHSLKDIKRYPEAFAVGHKRCEWCDEEIIVDSKAAEKAMKEYWIEMDKKEKERGKK